MTDVNNQSQDLPSSYPHGYNSIADQINEAYKAFANTAREKFEASGDNSSEPVIAAIELIPQKKSVRDLGVQVSASTDFHDQIMIVCKRARDKSNWIFRTFYSRNVLFLRFMWSNYIQPILDYASQLWSPMRQLDIKLLEDIFRNFSARAQKDNQENFDFWTRLHRYKIKSQQRRSERFRIIYTWKILEKLLPNCGLSWTENDKTGHICTIPVPNHKALDRVKTLKLLAFQTRGRKLFNSLPFTIRELTGCSLNVFKNKLDRYLNLFPDTPLSQKYHPLPSEVNTGHPSNSIMDWSRYFNISTRVNKSLEDLEKDILTSHKYIDLINSDWCHIHPTPPPPPPVKGHSVDARTEYKCLIHLKGPSTTDKNNVKYIIKGILLPSK